MLTTPTLNEWNKTKKCMYEISIAVGMELTLSTQQFDWHALKRAHYRLPQKINMADKTKAIHYKMAKRNFFDSINDIEKMNIFDKKKFRQLTSEIHSVALILIFNETNTV